METYDKCKSLRMVIVNRAAEVMAYASWSDDFAASQIRNIAFDLKNSGKCDSFFNIQPSEMTDSQLEDLGFGKWSEDTPMRLIPLWMLPFLAEKLEVEDINGEKSVVVTKDIDNDNRFGCLAYGVIPKDKTLS